MEVVKISGIVRNGIGKVATKLDRKNQTIPCVLYGGKDNVHFTITWSEVRHLIFTPDFKQAALTIEGKSYNAILKEVQFHPATEQIMHVDFLSLTPGTPIKVQVPLRLTGVSPGVKSGGRLIQSVRKIKIKCMPDKMVDHMMLDISNLELGATARVRDVIAAEGIEVTMQGAVPVVLIEIPRALRSAATAEAKAAGKKK